MRDITYIINSEILNLLCQ